MTEGGPGHVHCRECGAMIRLRWDDVLHGWVHDPHYCQTIIAEPDR